MLNKEQIERMYNRIDTVLDRINYGVDTLSEFIMEPSDDDLAYKLDNQGYAEINSGIDLLRDLRDELYELKERKNIWDTT